MKTKVYQQISKMGSRAPAGALASDVQQMQHRTLALASKHARELLRTHHASSAAQSNSSIMDYARIGPNNSIKLDLFYIIK